MRANSVPYGGKPGSEQQGNERVSMKEEDGTPYEEGEAGNEGIKKKERAERERESLFGTSIHWPHVPSTPLLPYL